MVKSGFDLKHFRKKWSHLSEQKPSSNQSSFPTQVPETTPSCQSQQTLSQELTTIPVSQSNRNHSGGTEPKTAG
jgi:hypothetical protein